MRFISRWILPVLVALLSLSLFACDASPSSGPAATTSSTSAVIPPVTTVTTPPPPATLPPTTISPTSNPQPSPSITASVPVTTAAGTVISPDFAETFKNHFGFMPAHWDFAGSHDAGGAYDRPFFEYFRWDMIERQPGVFDFSETDRYITEAQGYGMHILANIQPFAVWDQAKCHGPQPTGIPGKGMAESTKYKPCDMDAYRNFLSKMVERYDGDGIDDMPGLTMPIKHWELMNEPEFQTDIIYFQGSGADYTEVLKATSETVKQADPEALIVQGGMAGMMPESAAWWQSVFDAGGGQYFDIMNMHSIGHGEHLNIPSFKQLLSKNGLQDTPFWVTEVQYQQARKTENYSNNDFGKILARSYIFALANGADKLFYVNVRMPPRYDAGIPFDERSALISNSGEKSALFRAHLTMADVLGALGERDSIDIIKERVGDWHITEGQYRFTIGGKTVYALWGSGSLPQGLSGNVRVIDISGAETTVDAASLKLTDSPIFVFTE